MCCDFSVSSKRSVNRLTASALKPAPGVLTSTGHSDVGHDGCGSVLRVLQQVPRVVLGRQAAPHSDLLHQTATVRLPAGCSGLHLPDPSGSFCVSYFQFR